MANIQVKNVPEELHLRLKECAEQRRSTMREVVLRALERELGYEAFAARLRKRGLVDLDRPASDYVREAREERS